MLEMWKNLFIYLLLRLCNYNMYESGSSMHRTVANLDTSLLHCLRRLFDRSICRIPKFESQMSNISDERLPAMK